MPNNYVNTIYNIKDRPLTSYPDQLIQYLNMISAKKQ